MEEFVEIAANNMSLKGRKLVAGVGVNDAPYKVETRSASGKRVRCPYYKVWASMLNRCYSKANLRRQPTYKGCSVAPCWVHFTCFKKWMICQDFAGKDLDKDILVVGNKVYSPDTCVFVSKGLNYLLLSGGASHDPLPVGVYWHKAAGKYGAQCRKSITGMKHLGLFVCIKEAEVAYCTCKAKVIVDVSNQPEAASQPRLQEGLLRHAKVFSDRAAELSDQQSQHT